MLEEAAEAGKTELPLEICPSSEINFKTKHSKMNQNDNNNDNDDDAEGIKYTYTKQAAFLPGI